MPQPFPIPDLSLAEWGSRMEESPQWEIVSNSPVAPRQFGSIDVERDPQLSSPFDDFIQADFEETAVADEERQRKLLLDEIEAHIPTVWHTVEVINGSTC